MTNYKYIYGPIPSRRLGRSLGIAPIPGKTCNFSCVYCQLGQTRRLTNAREMFFPIEEIILELKQVLNTNIEYDIISIVGDGEPCLYLGLGKMIKEISKCSSTPICLITNGSLLSNKLVQEEVLDVDIIMPSLDAFDNRSFKLINRPHSHISFSTYVQGLIDFSNQYQGKLWLEVMLLEGLNDSDEDLLQLYEIIKKIKYERIYINTPLRPPAEQWVKPSSNEVLEKAKKILNGNAINFFSDTSFQSGIIDDYKAILSIISRHAMREEEINNFLEIRNNRDKNGFLDKLKNDKKVEVLNYQNTNIYRIK